MVKINKKIAVGMFLVIATLSLVFFVSAQFSKSSPQFTTPGSVGYLRGQGIDTFPSFNRDMCGKGQDFVLQIAPFGCSPAIVRSDLLEEQNVPVFCKISATKINPLIDVKAIESMSFKGQYPKEVSGVGFHPAKAAIRSQKTLLNSPVLNNIGYAVIVLRQQKNESAMPDFVEGKLTANIRYDVKNAFGIGKANYYLPELNDEQWSQRFNQYGFWNGKGFLRAEGIDSGGAVVSIYSDENNKISTFNLKKGQTSSEIYLPGFYCQAGLKLRLDGLEAPDTRAKLNINGEIVEVAEKEKFLQNSCVVKNIEKQGINQKVEAQCRTDEGVDRFELRITPKIRLSIEGVEEKEEGYGIGDFLYKNKNNNKFVYLAYAGTGKNEGGIISLTNSNDEKDLFAFLIEIPLEKQKLSDSEISSMASFIKRSTSSKTTGVGIADALVNVAKFYSSSAESILKYFAKGQSNVFVFLDKPKDVGGKEINLLGYSGPKDNSNILDENKDLKQNYENAISDYRKIINSFPNEKENQDSQKTFGEKALSNLIKLANSAEQKKKMVELCKEFEERYPKSEKPFECKDRLEISNSEISSRSVFVNSGVKEISFKGIYEPTLKEYGAEIFVRMPDGKTQIFNLGKNDIIYLDDKKKESIQLLSLDADSAKLNVNFRADTTIDKITKATISSSRKILKKDVSDSFGSKYTFTLTKINLKNVAKVSVLPRIDNAGTEANISFKIGIEKRGIQLSPDEIKNRIGNLNSSIKKWEDNSNKLGNVVKGFNAACLTTGAALTIKNFFSNLDGKSIARKEVMRSDGGYMDICKDEIAKTGDSIDKCLLNYNDDIENDVGIVQGIMKNQDAINEDTLCDKLEEINKVLGKSVNDPRDNSKSISLKNIKKIATSDDKDNKNCGKIRLSQARDLERLNKILDSGATEQFKKAANISRYRILSQINVDVKNYAEQTKTLKDLKKQIWISGAKNVDFRSSNKDAVVGNYGGATANDNYGGGIKKGDLIQPISLDNTRYYVTLKNEAGNFYSIENISDEAGNLLKDKDKISEIKSIFGKGFRKYDASTYQNKFKNPEVSYFETTPYKGFPAIVPFDTLKGWYAAMKQTISGSGKIRAYDESGKVASFYLCNVGENGKADFNSGVNGDDICQQYNPGTGQIYGTFPRLDEGKTSKLVSNAMNAIDDASRQYKSGVSGFIKIGNENIKVGKPAVNIPDVQCQDFMSPEECLLLFNVCDPVVCPPSRCDLGGLYPVSDVVQSGIVGSTLLCLPNIKEKIAVPVCLSGIKAGMDSLISVQKNYRDCLQENLDTGATVGICDEIHSIYLCDFFWNQVGPLSQIAIPKIFEYVTGQSGSRGGGEYLGVQSAWKTAQDSADYMTKYYGANSFQAFNVKATEGIGKAVCRNFVSATYPSDLGLSSLIEPRSPPQFSAWFSEQTFTTATVPATSQYKVFYHIYAGKNNLQNAGAYYSVYLKSPSGTSFYQANPTINVASGYIAKGDYASQTKDFTAPSGYKELCITVNGQEECGFKQVSTEFALNRLNDLYMKEQASQTDINSEATCVSGTPSLYGLINPNLQAGEQSVANPQLYNRGIVRVCSTDNPGKGTDAGAGTKSGRWQEVGDCDDGKGKIKCYIDTKSVKNVIKSIDLKNQTLDKVSNNLELLRKGDFITDFGKELDKIKELESEGKINYITNILDKAIYAQQKAKLLLMRGDGYAKIVIKLVKASIEKRTSAEAKSEKEKTQEGDLNNNQGNFDNLEVVSETSNCNQCGGSIFSCSKTKCAEQAKYLNKNCVWEGRFFKTCSEKVEAKSYCNNIQEGVPLSVEFKGCITSREINNLLENSPAKGMGEEFVSQGKRYDIDPIIALAFFNKESKFGTQGRATKTKSIGNIKYSNNCPGININEFCGYNSWEDSIKDWYNLIGGDAYVGEGRDTIEKIIPKYAPSSKNDVPAYIKNVRNFVKRNKGTVGDMGSLS